VWPLVQWTDGLMQNQIFFWVDRGTTSAQILCPTTNAFRKCDAGIAVTSSS
jgi:hypothetical protein